MKYLRHLFVLALLALGVTGQAANYITASVLVDTHANILAKTGLYTQQRAYATDFSGASAFWNGSAWLWDTRCQMVLAQRTDVTAPTDTVDNALVTFTLPKLGSKDSLRVKGVLTATNNANVKTLAVKLGSVGAMASGMSFDIASGGQVIFMTEMNNADATGTQKWQSNNKNIWGVLSGAPATTSKATGTAGLLLTVNMAKATGGDSVVLNWLTIELCGGGAV
jgi:hypothetical protein